MRGFIVLLVIVMLLPVGALLPVVARAGLDGSGQYLMRAEDTPWVTMARVVRGLGGGDVVIDRSSTFALSKTILALTAVGKNPRESAQGDLIDYFLKTYIRDEQIGDLQYVNDDFWGIMALRSAGIPASDAVVQGARAFVLRAQKENGGWSWSPTYPTADTDDTAAAIMALRAADVHANDPVVVRARDYLRKSQNSDGGFPNVPPGPSSIESTAWAVSALSALGEQPAQWTHNPIAYLEAQQRDDGSWGSADATAFVIIAREGKWYPVRIMEPHPETSPLPVASPARPAFGPSPARRGRGWEGEGVVAPAKQQKKKVIKKEKKKIKQQIKKRGQTSPQPSPMRRGRRVR